MRNASSRGKALGINGIFGGLGVGAAGLVAGGLTDLISWRAAFMVPGVISLATGFALLYAIRRGLVADGKAADGPGRRSSRGDMIRVFAILLITMALMGIIFQSTQTAIPKVFDLRLRGIAGDSIFGIGAIVSAVYTVGGLMQLIGGHLADRYPLKPIYVGAFLFQVPILAAIAFFGGLPLIVVAMITVLLSTGALPAENMLLARYSPDRHQSLAFGAKFVLAFGTAPLAIQLVSWVQAQTGDFVWLFAVLAASAGIAMIAAAMLPGGWVREGDAAPVEAAE